MACCNHSADLIASVPGSNSSSFACSSLKLSYQAGPRLIPVLRDQNDFAIPPAGQIAAFAGFCLPPNTGGFQLVPSVMAPSVIVPDNMLIDLVDDIIDYPVRFFAYPDPHEMANDSLVVCRHRLDFRADPPADQVTETPQFRASGRSCSPRALPPRIRSGSHCHCIVSLATLSIFHASAWVQRSSVAFFSVSVVSTTSRGGVSSNPPRFLGSALFQEGDSDTCWSGAGMLKTAHTFVSVTSEKHASSAPACIVDHPIRTC